MEYTSLKAWWDLNLPLIDVRETQGNNAIASTDSRLVVYLPFSTLLSGERSCELPPRNMAFGILLEEVHGDAEHEFRQELLRNLFFATSSKATQQSRKPWKVSAILIATPELWEESRSLGIHRSIDALAPASSLFEPLARLWQPNPLISDILWPILEQQLRDEREDCTVWDLGSGAGRDACFIAEKIKSCGWIHCHVIGLDNHKASAKRCEPFWRHRHVSELTKAKNLNLSKLDLVEQELDGSNVTCFYAVRFLHRKLITFLAKSSKLKPGTVFAMSHFCKPYEGAEWIFEHPKVMHPRSCMDVHYLMKLTMLFILVGIKCVRKR